MPADRLNRWVILPAGVIINVCIESNYAWSVWILPGDMPEECKGLRRADPHGSLGHRDCDDADPEHYFGIVHADLKPTPGYLAYRALTKARPAGSVNQPGELFLADGKLCVISWKRPDGQRAYAIWCSDDSVTKNVLISGELTDAFD